MARNSVRSIETRSLFTFSKNYSSCSDNRFYLSATVNQKTIRIGWLVIWKTITLKLDLGIAN